MFALVVFSFLLLAPSSALRSDSFCFPDFDTNPAVYAICEKKLCFLLLPEPPFVFPGQDPTGKHLRPFPCSRLPTENQYGVKGMFFDMLTEMSNIEDANKTDIKEAMCLYGGSRCTFEGIINFMQDTSSRSNSLHRFIAGGWFIALPHRRTMYTIQSAPLFTTEMVLVHNPARAKKTFKNALDIILEPFEFGAWLVVGLSVLFLGVCFLLYLAFCPEDCRRPIPAIEWFLIGEKSANAIEATTWHVLKFICGVFFAVLILMYEVAIAVRIFHGPVPFIDDMNQVKKLDLETLTCAAGTAMEVILQTYLGRKYLDPQTIPWIRAASLEETVDFLQRGTAKYIFSFDEFVKFVIHKRRLCDEVLSIPLNMKISGGWYYSANIAKGTTDSIDKWLSQLNLLRVPTNGLVKYANLPEDCGAAPTKVDTKVMFLLIICAIGPLLLIFIICFLLSWFLKWLRRRRRKKELEKPLTKVVGKGRSSVITYNFLRCAEYKATV